MKSQCNNSVLWLTLCLLRLLALLASKVQLATSQNNVILAFIFCFSSIIFYFVLLHVKTGQCLVN